jgi:thiosulfate dehydrogenase (quinone) large subunit
MSTSSSATDSLGALFALLLLRLWLGLRALQTGVEKFAGYAAREEVVEVDGEANAYGLTDVDTDKVYALTNMHGVPTSLYDRLLAEPLLPTFGLTVFDFILAPLLLILGTLILLGVALRCSLFAMGLVYTSLTFGLILLGQDAGIAWLGTHVLLIVVALLFVQHNRFSLMKSY